MANKFFEGLDVAENYAKYRPACPEVVTTTIMEYVYEKMKPDETGRLPLAVDVGCGTGYQSTVQLAEYFHRIIGTDISMGQIEVAQKSGHPESVEFRLRQGEELPVPDESVNLFQGAISVHWFDLDAFYKECERALVPGGVIAVFSKGQYYTVVDHVNSAEIDKILVEIAEVPMKKGYYEEGNNISIRRYTDPQIQIPYKDNKRVDNITQQIDTSVSSFINLYRTHSPYRRMLQSEPEFAHKWFSDVTDRLLAAIDTRDPDSPFTCKVEIFMLLGRKPMQ